MAKPLIPVRTLTSLRQINERAMQDSCTIVRSTESDDGGGSTTPTGETLITTDCSFLAIRDLPADRETLEERGDYRLTVPLSTPILETDQVRYQGRLYRVVWAPPADALAVERLVGLVEA